MKNFYLAETSKTPKIECELDSGTFHISGRSIPENSIEFYKPLFDWLDSYVENPHEKTEMNVQLEYFNTSSSKCLVEVFRRLEKVKEKGQEVAINWFYEEDDEDMEESGEDFKEIINIQINMIEIEE
jgi:hypothetical protein